LFSGKFKMVETLSDLTGTQSRTFKQKGLIKFCLGASGGLTDRISLRAEAFAVPAGGVIDLGAAVRLLYSF
jgi:hypothetical protein